MEGSFGRFLGSIRLVEIHDEVLGFRILTDKLVFANADDIIDRLLRPDLVDVERR